MSLMDILNQYAGLAPGAAAPNASEHFGTVAQEAPREDLAHGLSAAFRADQTPPFEQMVGRLFGRSDPQQRAGVLNEILRSLGRPQVSPQEAEGVTTSEAEELARHAATANPGIIDRISQFYAQHPALVQTLGNAALSIALSRMAQRRAA